MKSLRFALLLGWTALFLASCAGQKNLPAWDPPPYFAQEKYAQVDGARVAYVEAGEQNPNAVVFIHGFSGDLQNWWDQYDYFQQNFHVLILDNPGHGKSEKCGQEPCSIDLFARTVVGLMAERGIAKAVLVGNSMGGGIAAYVAIHYPERVEKLVLSDSAGSGQYGPLALLLPVATPRTIKLIGVTKDRQYRGQDPKDRARSAMTASFGGTTEERPYLIALDQAITSTVRTRIRDDFPKIAAPTLLIWGDDDPLVKPKTMDVFSQGIPDTTSYLVHQGGHTPQMQTPAEFNCAVENFILGQDLEPCHGKK